MRHWSLRSRASISLPMPVEKPSSLERTRSCVVAKQIKSMTTATTERMPMPTVNPCAFSPPIRFTSGINSTVLNMPPKPEITNRQVCSEMRSFGSSVIVSPREQYGTLTKEKSSMSTV